MGLRQAIRASEATEANVRTASRVSPPSNRTWRVERMKLFAKISPILTQEQREKLADMEQRMDDFADYAIARAGRKWRIRLCGRGGRGPPRQRTNRE